MRNSISEIYEELNLSSESTPDSILNHYLNNSIYLNNISSFEDEVELSQYIQLILFYVMVIYQKGRYNEIVEIISNKQAIIEGEIKRHDAQYLEEDWYNEVCFYSGMALYSLRDFKSSTLVFNNLSNRDPKNEKYKDWLIHSRYKKQIWK